MKYGNNCVEAYQSFEFKGCDLFGLRCQVYLNSLKEVRDDVLIFSKQTIS